MHRGTWFGLVAVFCGSLFLTGCGCSGGGNPVPPKKNGEEGHEHSHSHDAVGPHGGQVMMIGKEEYHAEFVLDTMTNKVTVYLLDKDIKTNPAAASAQETITIEVKAGAETTNYELAAVERTTGDMPTAQQFELVDKSLHGPIKTELATLKVTIAGKEFADKISFSGHGHDH